jgi:peroxiredoxin Q/BCP
MSKEQVRPDDRGQGTDGGTSKAQFGWTLVIGVVACLVLYTVFVTGPSSRHTLSGRIVCGSHMSALGKAILVYANDNDGRFPTPAKWCDLLIENADVIPEMFICPQSGTVYGESSYAMNVNLVGKKIDEVSPDTVLLFETDLGKEEGQRKETVSSREFFKFLGLSETEGEQKVYGGRWNQVGGLKDVTLEHHKGGVGCNVLFVDGHVEFEKSVDGLRWQVEQAKVELKVADEAPAFSLPDQENKVIKLSDFAGKKVLVYFYPKAGTPGCTKQACSVRDSAQELKKAGVVPLGISPDEPNEQRQFDKEYSLGFRLLSDTDHKTAERYGVWSEKDIGGKKVGMIIRSSFLADEKGKLIGVWYNVRPEDTVPNAMEALKQLNTKTPGSK